MAGVAHALTPPPQMPGRPKLHSVPYGGKGQGHGKRLKKRKPAKLTKEQKKALKWARKHPEEGNPSVMVGLDLTGPVALNGPVRMYNNNITVTNAATTITGDDTTSLYTPSSYTPTIQLNQFVGQPATDRTYAEIQRAAAAYADQFTATGNVITATNVYVDNGTTGAFTVNDWAAWNQETTGGGLSVWVDVANPHPQQNRVQSTPRYQDTSWAGWQGRGHEADMWVNPNDQLQQRRLRQERDLAAEADRALRRQEQMAQETVRREERRVQLAAETERRKAAKDRSYALLHRHLTDEQLTMLENESRFLIEVNSGKIYEIRRGIHQNIYRLNDEGRIVEQLCAAPRGDIPEGDAMLAQMLHLMVNEEEFRRVANTWDMQDHRSNADRRLPLRAAA